ncbi:hypothetical protein PR003_g18146 [Phytophthora rubi]|uniref:Reverse transcriptase RNase H-like domain-containing protein n=1 Tax=Phytophthora rubi TaxID=129364 RepID=A0A6A4E6D4_9STRA|nr:hypothetical protein PR003_g18146 [Phytophthora rubi]
MRYVLIKFRVYLLGEQTFAVYTDHASLRTATKSPYLSQRMARWFYLFSEYNFVVHYKPGKTTTTETQIIVRPAPDALRAAGPAKHNADASTPSEMEEKPPAPASKKHLGDSEEAKDALASKKQANDVPDARKTPASEKPARGTEAGRPSPASKKRSAAAATKKKTTSASVKPTRKTKKTAASSKPAPKKAAVKKPSAKQLPKKKGPAKESPKTPKLPPKRTDVLLPGPHEEVSSESSDTDTPNPGLIDDAGPSASRYSNAPRASASSPPRPAKANVITTPPQGRSPSPDPSLQVDYEESESDKDHEVGEVEWSPLTRNE